MLNDKIVNSIMKRNYIIPSTQSVVFSAGFICQSVSPATGSNVNTNIPGLGTGGGQEIGDPD